MRLGRAFFARDPLDVAPELLGKIVVAGDRSRDLCSGPAKLCQALGICGDQDGIDLVSAEAGVEIVRDPADVGARVAWQTSRRVGLGKGKADEIPWRFYLPGAPNVSASPR